jgi:hypothetical protein
MLQKFIDSPMIGTKYNVDDTIKEVWEVLDEIYESPIRRYWLIINTEGELDLIFLFRYTFIQSVFFKERW